MRSLRVLTSETAELHTAQVSIKTLTVGGKQVTLAVFRQLLEEPIIDLTNFTLRGIPWGHVRYQVERSHVHAINVIWQLGSELRRCEVDRKWHPPYGGNKDLSVADVRSTFEQDTEILGLSRWKITLPRWNQQYPSCSTTDPDHDRQVAKWRVAQSEAADRRQQAKRRLVEQVNEKFRFENEAAEAAIKKYDALVVPLFELPQLFIAV